MKTINIKVECKYKDGDKAYFHRYSGMVDSIKELQEEIVKVTIKKIDHIETEGNKKNVWYSTDYYDCNVLAEERLFPTWEKAIIDLGRQQLGFAKQLLSSTNSDLKNTLRNAKIEKHNIERYGELIKELSEIVKGVN